MKNYWHAGNVVMKSYISNPNHIVEGVAGILTGQQTVQLVKERALPLRQLEELHVKPGVPTAMRLQLRLRLAHGHGDGESATEQGIVRPVATTRSH